MNLGIPRHMIQRAKIGFQDLWNPLKIIFQQNSIPKNGWKDAQIRMLLKILSSFDSDKDIKAIRIGEREARTSSPILNEIASGFCHGIGRSGDLTAPQPKAAGASLMQALCNRLMLSLVNNLGIVNVKGALSTPMGTGMSLAMALRGLFNYYETNIQDKNGVLYPRADHKSPPKGINFVGGKIIQVEGHFGENHFAPEGAYVDIEDIKSTYFENKNKISSIVSTTSFFAPRVPDEIKEIAKFADEYNLIHVINNAYGIQSEILIKKIRSAIDAGRVDAIIQSNDKNFLTPVGGGVILSPKEEIIEAISSCYAGRASATPTIQLLVSLLSMGLGGYQKQMKKQTKNMKLLNNKLQNLAESMGERVIDCKNPISCAMTLRSLDKDLIADLGGYLYNLRVTGPRVVNVYEKDFGACTDEIRTPYVVMNAAIGVKRKDIMKSKNLLEKAIRQLKKN